ncbi:MAG: hypothetical protein SV062_00750 [Thermodesulfobacteriota bacterium]|nr:hypothetical protein [Thermodesulfobacteriota bacterium]
MKDKPMVFLLFLGLLEEVFCLGILCLGDLRTNVLWFIPVYLLCFIPYFLSVNVIKKGKTEAKKILLIIILFAVLFRLTLFLSPPTLSDDIYRYLWDGRVGSHSINPYSHPPDAEKISWLRDNYYSMINHKEIPTIYPPFTQIIFTLTDRLLHSIQGMKAVFIMFDVMIIFVIYKILSFKRYNPLLIIIYAWNPLILIEFSGSGHNDSQAIFLLVISLYFFLLNRCNLSVIFLSLSFLSKYLAILFLPLYLRRVKKSSLPLFFFIAICLYLPYLNAGRNLFSGLLTYAEHWRFNDSIFQILLWTTGSVIVSKCIAVSVLMLVLCRLLKCGKDILQASYFLTGTCILLSPTLHPWYLTWLIPFLCFFPSRAWLLFSALIGLSYYVLVDYTVKGIWHESPYIKILEFIPFYSLLLYEKLASLKSPPDSQ